MAVPTRKTSEAQLNEFNAWMRGQPWYETFFRSRGLDPNRVKLSDRQREQLGQVAAQHGLRLPGGMKFDEAGNLNQRNTLGRNVAIGAAATGLALTGLGAAGIGPMAGAFGGSAAAGGTGAAAAGGGAAASGAIPTIGSTVYPTLAAAGPSLAGASTIGGIIGGSAVPTAAELLAEAGIPTIGSRAIGNGMGRDPARLPNPTFDLDDVGGLADTGTGNRGSGDTGLGDGDTLEKLIKTALLALAGYPALRGGVGGAGQLSAEEKVQQDRINRLLAQQEQRTQFQNPLYEATTRMAYGLLPKMGNNGTPYPIASLGDVKIPGFE